MHHIYKSIDLKSDAYAPHYPIKSYTYIMDAMFYKIRDDFVRVPFKNYEEDVVAYFKSIDVVKVKNFIVKYLNKFKIYTERDILKIPFSSQYDIDYYYDTYTNGCIDANIDIFKIMHAIEVYIQSDYNEEIIFYVVEYYENGEDPLEPNEQFASLLKLPFYHPQYIRYYIPNFPNVVNEHVKMINDMRNQIAHIQSLNTRDTRIVDNSIPYTNSPNGIVDNISNIHNDRSDTHGTRSDRSDTHGTRRETNGFISYGDESMYDEGNISSESKSDDEYILINEIKENDTADNSDNGDELSERLRNLQMD
jgi:hypothetical protein